MGSAATTARERQAPAWKQQKVDLKSGFWTATPNEFFTELPSKCTGLEYAIVGQIIYRTYGSREKGQWCKVTEEELAEELLVTVDGVHQAIERLEELEVIEAKKVGRGKVYRARPENFAAAPDKDPRKLSAKVSGNAYSEPKKKAQATEPEYSPKTFVVMPGRSEAITLDEYVSTIRYRNDGPDPVSFVGRQVDSDTFELCFEQPKPVLETGFPASAAPSIPVLQSGYSVRDLKTAVNAKLKKIGVFATLAHLPSDSDYQAIHARLKGASIDQFLAIVENKREKVKRYGFLLNLADEAAAAADEWRSLHAPPPPPAPDLADFEDDWIDYKSRSVSAHLDQIGVDRFRELINHQKRLYLQQYKAAEHWPPQTLQETARHAAIVELERELGLMSLEEFAAAQRKSAGRETPPLLAFSAG
jgi:DNA-binding transcriptional ArsR family regulator